MTFTRTIAGREIEFRDIAPGQLTALRLFQKQSAKKSKRIAKDESVELEVRLQQVQDIYDTFNMKVLDLVEGLLVNPDDADFLVDVQIAGALDAQDLFVKIIHGDEPAPDDDEDPEPPKPKKVVPNPIKKAATAKKAANAKRTTR